MDTPEDVIVRLLERVESKSLGERTDIKAPPTSAADLVSHVGRVPHGSMLRSRYKGQEYTAEVKDGRVVWNGRSYSSLSAAAVGVINSTGSRRGTENGWRFWEVRAPDSKDWKPAAEYLTK